MILARMKPCQVNNNFFTAIYMVMLNLVKIDLNSNWRAIEKSKTLSGVYNERAGLAHSLLYVLRVHD